VVERAVRGVVVDPHHLLHPRPVVHRVGRLGHVRVKRSEHQPRLALETEDLAAELRSLLGQRVTLGRAPHFPDCRLDMRQPGAEGQLNLALKQHLRELVGALAIGEDIPVPHHLPAAVLRTGATAHASKRAVLVGQRDQRRVGDGEGGDHQTGWNSAWKLRVVVLRTCPLTTLTATPRSSVPAGMLAALLVSVSATPAAAVMAAALVTLA
jgi:hypothetical protein